MARIDFQKFFTAEQWQRISSSPTAYVEKAMWEGLSKEQKGAVLELRAELMADGAALPARTSDKDALQGGDGGTHWAGKNALIHEIQGTGPKSPMEGQKLTTQGIVTGVDPKGFYIQEPNQGIEQGSPGIFVFTGRRPNVSIGDDVSVSGTVTEFTKPTDAERFPDSSQTQLNANPKSIAVKSSGNTVPEIVIGKGGIELSHTESNAVLWENLEGARVRINNPDVVGAPNMIPRFPDMAVVPDGGEGAGPRTIAGGLIRDAHGNPHAIGVRMPVDDLGPVNIGARFPKGLAGNVVERHGRHQVTVYDSGGPDNLIPSTFKAEVSQLRKQFPKNEHVLFVASLNAENKDVHVEDVTKVDKQDPINVDDDVGDGKLTMMAQQIVNNLTSPDIVAMQEIQDNDGTEISDVTDASVTWEAIIEEIVKQGGPRYAWVDAEPKTSGAGGGAPGGNIRNGFLYDPTRVKLLSSAVLEDKAFAESRPPLIASFEFKHGDETEVVTLQSVHNTSKRGRTKEEALQRQIDQEAAINGWAKENAPKTQYQHLGVFGDRNAYTDEASLQAELKDNALELLSLQLPEERRYSTQYGGSSGELDHASAKSSVPITIDLVHMNSDFDERFRSSDHDGTLTAWDFRRGKA